ncbi:MAG: hypothetical protein H0U74_00950 [Bradymonadaceae bacterium]|nr:hypothetical protein [Lujinxingiaceae bacterium]
MNVSPTHTLFLTVAMVLGLVLSPSLAFGQDGIHINTGKTAIAQVERDTYIEEETRVEERETVVQPRTVQPEAQQQQRTEIREQRVVTTRDRPHWMYTVGRNALMGGVIGGIVGGGVYLLSRLEWSPWVIAQFAGGGILVGATAGLIEVILREDILASQASTQYLKRDLPNAVQLRLFHVNF